MSTIPGTAARTAARIAAALLTLAPAGGTGLAQDAIVQRPQEMVFKAPFPGYPEVATVYGDPSQPGLYVQRVRFKAGFKIQPHWHPDALRTVVVLSGTLHFAYGEQWDEAKLVAYPAGTFFTEPSKAPHFAWARDGEVELQLTGMGPAGTTMLKPAKD